MSDNQKNNSNSLGNLRITFEFTGNNREDSTAGKNEDKDTMFSEEQRDRVTVTI